MGKKGREGKGKRREREVKAREVKRVRYDARGKDWKGRVKKKEKLREGKGKVEGKET